MLLVIAMLALGAALGPGRAAASEVSVSTAGFRDNSLSIVAAPGERNEITVSAKSDGLGYLSVRIFDATARLKAGRKCQSLTEHASVCSLGDTKVQNIAADLGDGADSFAVDPWPEEHEAGVSVFGRGGADHVAIGWTGADERLTAELHGGGGADRLESSGRDDRIDAEGGNDLVVSGAGEDKIFLGPGDDQARAKRGADRVDGGGGDDRIAAGAGADMIRGEGGSDKLGGGSGGDVILAGRLAAGRQAPIEMSGVDEIDGGAGEDRAELNPWDRSAGCEERSLRRLVHFIRPVRVRDTGAIILAVETVGPGRVTISGPGIERYAAQTRDVGAGFSQFETRLRIRPRGFALDALRAHRSVLLRLAVEFRRATGETRTETQWLRLEKR